MWASLRRILTLLALVLAVVLVVTFLKFEFPAYGDAFRYVYAGLILIGGVAVSRELANLVAKELRSKLAKNALILGNLVAVLGYVASAAAAGFYLSFSPTVLLASAAVSGLVLGLALQPTLGSFFAGVLILVSGAIRPGDQVRIMSWHIPFQWAFLPGYKYFSPDAIYAGYLAEVVEIGLFFTTITTEEGQTMKIPNTIIATDAAIVTYTNKDYIFNVRYEFPNKFDPDVVLKRVREETKGFPVLSVYVNEQSDKEYYIVKLVLNAKEKDHAALKSEILTRFIRLHRVLNVEAQVAREK